MRLYTILICGLLMSACALSAPQAFANPLKKHQWKNRILVVFTPNEAHEEFEEFLDEMDNYKNELNERDFIVTMSSANRDHSSQLRQHFRTPRNTFKIYVIDKDGGVKLEKDHAITMPELLAVVDSMPIRQREIAAQNAKASSHNADNATENPGH